MKNLKEAIDNIFYNSISAIGNPAAFAWHTDANRRIDSYKPHSSQALMIDVFGMLKNSEYIDSIIRSVFGIEDSDWSVQFEYKDKSLLKEKQPSQIDIVLFGKMNCIVIECKFMEKDGGACSQTTKRRGMQQCNGNYQLQVNPINNIKNKCSLTGKGIQYWENIRDIYTYDITKEMSPCPFKGGSYQWMRNLCIAKAIEDRTKKKSLFFLCYADLAISPIAIKIKNNYIKKLNTHINDAYEIHTITYETIIEAGIELAISERTTWLELKDWLLRKYETIRPISS